MKLEENEARTRFAEVPVVRLATADDLNRPHLVATTFVVADDVIFSAVDGKPKQSRNLKRLRNIQLTPHVSVLADHYAEDWTELWWARADGTATVIEAEDDMAEPLRLLADRYWQYRRDRPEGPVIAVAVERWTGWAYADRGQETSIK
ncbi:MAG: TIGR03668 family PPOX class F420-dependent oxidoreductase [Pseudonocardiaceae bacterium]